jgi:putative ABC transport system ATP-binding protein
VGASTGCTGQPALTKERPEVPVLDPIHLDAVGMQDTAPAVAAAGLVRRYGHGATAVDALRGVDLAIEAGEMVAVMGPSGSGKSTLMHLLAGLDRPTSGTVRIAGQDITKLKEAALTRLRRDRIGFVFQGFNLLPTLTAEENVALPIRLAGRTNAAAQTRIDTLLQRVGLSERKRHRPAELSGGQQQRVAVARALVTEPAVVFADEPTGNLDSRSSAEVLGLLRDAASDFGRAVVMVTHDARAAAEADRVLFLADGLVVAERSHLSSAEILDAMKEIAR